MRGFALLGILVANILSFSGYLILPPRRARALATGPADGVVLFLIHVFVDGKFYSAFAFLFGFGFGLQLSRSDHANEPLIPRFARRLAVLFLLGLLHAILLEWGDILSVYALTGALLIPFQRAKPKTVLLAALCCLLLPIPLYALMLLRHGFDPTGPKLSPAEL